MAKEMIIEQSVVIDKPRQEVYDYLKHAMNQNEFSVWNMTDPDQKITSEGTDGTVGFVYTWDSQNKNVGAGAQEIKNLVEGERIDYELRFERPMKNVSQSSFILTDAADGGTEVTWDFRGPMKFPMSLFSGFFAKTLGKQLAQSLQNLKDKLEG